MASEKLKLFSKIEVEVTSSAVGTLKVLTDQPGYGMALRFTWNVAASHLVNGVLARRTVTSRLPYNTQGNLIQCILNPGTGQTALYRARVWARELPAGAWQWYPLPVIDTPVEFQPVQFPIPPTSEEWQSAQLQIPPTPEEWSRLDLAIPPTPEEWRALSLPIKPTPEVPEWTDLEVDK